MITIIHCKSDFLRLREGHFLVLNSPGPSWICYGQSERPVVVKGAIVVFDRGNYYPQLRIPWLLETAIEQFGCRHIVGGTGHNDPFTVRKHLARIIKDWMRFPWTEETVMEWFSFHDRNLMSYEQNFIMMDIARLIKIALGECDSAPPYRRPSLAQINAYIDRFFRVAAIYRQVNSAPREPL